MDLNTIPLFTLLQNKLGYLGERERMIAQNVANASTPGYTPHDLKAFSEQPGMKAGPTAPVVTLATPTATVATSATAAMLPLPSSSGSAEPYATTEAPDSETTLDGNQVVIEEQMIKMSDAHSDYDAAIGFYQKALGMLHLAVQKPGG
jgi:flagellar basal-body rod protein FlgB